MVKDDKTFENLPNSAAEYVNLVIKNMRYRKKARDEVRDELIDHFELHLKDCATNEEKEQKAQKLISEFGDAKLLAKLMRRAKKRCRPLWRTVVARTFQTIAVMIILFILYIAWFLTGKPVITTNYIAQLNKLVRPTADDSLNAAPIYNKAIETLVDIDDVRGLFKIDIYDTNDEQKNIISNWLAKNKEPLALVEKASKLPYCWQHYESKEPEQSMLSVLLPQLGPFRQIAYALCSRAWLNAQAGDFNSAFENIEICYRLGRHYRGEKILVEQLVGMAIKSRALQTARQILDTCKIESGTLAAFQQHLQSLIEGDNFKPDFRLEKFFLYDELQRCFTESRFGPSHLYPKHVIEISGLSNYYDPNLDPMTDLILTLGLSPNILFSPNKTETIASIDAFYKLFEDNLFKNPARLKAEGIDPDSEISRIAKHNIFLRMLMPSLARINIIAFRTKIDAESALVIIALVRYKQDTGAYPETLDELMKQGYIKQAPIDPFSGSPITYRKTNGDFLLYSWGANLKDDSGQIVRDKDGKVRFTDEGDWVFWPVEKN